MGWDRRYPYSPCFLSSSVLFVLIDIPAIDYWSCYISILNLTYFVNISLLLSMPEPVTALMAANGEMDEKPKEVEMEETEEEAKKAEDRERGAKGALSLLAVIILGSAYLVAFCSRLFAVIRFESIIHEFDPW